jgi:hypothetical protein
MSTNNLQQLQDKNYLTTPQISEGNSEQQVEGKELVEAKSSELHSEQTQEVLQENIKPGTKPKSNTCITVRPCPFGNRPECTIC